MTKHLIALVRLAGRSYHILIKLTNVIERFPLDRFIAAIDLFIQWAEVQGAAADLGMQPQSVAAHRPTENLMDEKTHYEEHELMTVKEAIEFIPVSRSKLFEWRKEQKLQTIERNCRNIRLVRSEVEAMRTWARNKGKR